MDAKLEALEKLNENDSRNQAILIVTAVFFGLSLLSVILRCFVRTHIIRVWGWDDRIMVLAMVSYPEISPTHTFCTPHSN
jgi:hypothetical protein